MDNVLLNMLLTLAVMNIAGLFFGHNAYVYAFGGFMVAMLYRIVDLLIDIKLELKYKK